ncbi:MAG TPA: hypothetical protein VNU92_05030 [Edaphobacter sp.]|jgi:hypothetical protein|nr:hypothetical protein [Edaphobacter sp.]
MLPLRTVLMASIVAATPLALAADLSRDPNVVVCHPHAGCIHHTIFGHDYKVLNTDRFTVMVSLSNEGSYTRADVSITNLTSTPINLSPEEFRIQALSRAKVFPYVSPSRVENIPTPDRMAYIPANTLVSEREAARQRDAQEAAELFASAPLLKAITIPPNQAVHGRVYFERDASAAFQQINVVLPIAGTVFKFPGFIKP